MKFGVVVESDEDGYYVAWFQSCLAAALKLKALMKL
jgi:predicted RNase H-like HicB family nuclease